jgi:inositol oxygenase
MKTNWNHQQPRVIDPSELLRPEPEFLEKSVSKFRDYSIDETDPLKEMVRKTYRQMHLNQTVDFVKSKWFF